TANFALTTSEAKAASSLLRVHLDALTSRLEQARLLVYLPSPPATSSLVHAYHSEHRRQLARLHSADSIFTIPNRRCLGHVDIDLAHSLALCHRHLSAALAKVPEKTLTRSPLLMALQQVLKDITSCLTSAADSHFHQPCDQRLSPIPPDSSGSCILSSPLNLTPQPSPQPSPLPSSPAETTLPSTSSLHSAPNKPTTCIPFEQPAFRRGTFSPSLLNRFSALTLTWEQVNWPTGALGNGACSDTNRLLKCLPSLPPVRRSPSAFHNFETTSSEHDQFTSPSMTPFDINSYAITCDGGTSSTSSTKAAINRVTNISPFQSTAGISSNSNDSGASEFHHPSRNHNFHLSSGFENEQSNSYLVTSRHRLVASRDNLRAIKMENIATSKTGKNVDLFQPELSLGQLRTFPRNDEFLRKPPVHREKSAQIVDGFSPTYQEPSLSPSFTNPIYELLPSAAVPCPNNKNLYIPQPCLGIDDYRPSKFSERNDRDNLLKSHILDTRNKDYSQKDYVLWLYELGVSAAQNQSENPLMEESDGNQIETSGNLHVAPNKVGVIGSGFMFLESFKARLYSNNCYDATCAPNYGDLSGIL
ncbi:unnamed protein product, partial [Protopolystoma xenopodis]